MSHRQALHPLGCAFQSQYLTQSLVWRMALKFAWPYKSGFALNRHYLSPECECQLCHSLQIPASHINQSIEKYFAVHGSRLHDDP